MIAFEELGARLDCGEQERQQSHESKRRRHRRLHAAASIIAAVVACGAALQAKIFTARVFSETRFVVFGLFFAEIKTPPRSPPRKRKMILTNCAACAAPLAHDAPRCVRCKTRYCNATCQHDHWRRGHKQMCKKIHRGGNAEKYHADKKYKEALAEAVEACVAASRLNFQVAPAETVDLDLGSDCDIEVD